MLHTVSAIATRQDAALLFSLSGQQLGAFGFFTTPARRVSGYSAVQILASSAVPFSVSVEESASEAGPWIRTGTLLSSLDPASGLQVVVGSIQPVSELMRLVVTSLSAIPSTVTLSWSGLPVGGAALPGGGGGGGFSVSVVPFVYNLANTMQPLGAGGVYNGPIVAIDNPLVGSRGSNRLDSLAVLSGGGTLEILVSKDGATFYAQRTDTLNPGVPDFIEGLRLSGRFARARLTDGGSGSVTVVLHADLRSL